MDAWSLFVCASRLHISLYFKKHLCPNLPFLSQTAFAQDIVNMLFSLAFCAMILVNSALAQNYRGCKGRLYANIGMFNSKHPPAQSYCSSKFPMHVQTSTVTAPTATVTAIIPVTTTTTGTIIITATFSTSTSILESITTDMQIGMAMFPLLLIPLITPSDNYDYHDGSVREESSQPHGRPMEKRSIVGFRLCWRYMYLY